MKSLSDKQIWTVAVGAMHTVCAGADGRLYSWGVNDDGALGRSSGDQNEPHPVELPDDAKIRSIACGDNHSCALDALGRVWLWGTYKDSNGHIGIARKRRAAALELKSAEPGVVLEGASQICSGDNHTVALVCADATPRVFVWGANGTGQLGVGSRGCGLNERTVPAADVTADAIKALPDGGCEYDGAKVVRLALCSGVEELADKKTAAQLVQALAASGSGLVLLTERDVSKAEKQALLLPVEMDLAALGEDATAVFASADCTFVRTAGQVHGCGLNGDGQVGLGFVSMAVEKLRPISGIQGAQWIGGGQHFTAALVDGAVFTWGVSEETGHGLAGKAPIAEPRKVLGPSLQSLPPIRQLRCGGSHTLACSAAGDVFLWGIGISHQLGNRPRDVNRMDDKDEAPDLEPRPYRLSSKQLAERFVLAADGGSQHSAELAWNGKYGARPAASEEENPNKRARTS